MIYQTIEAYFYAVVATKVEPVVTSLSKNCWLSFRFALPDGMLCTKRNENGAWSQVTNFVDP